MPWAARPRSTSDRTACDWEGSSLFALIGSASAAHSAHVSASYPLLLWHKILLGALPPTGTADGARPWSYIRRHVPVVPLSSRMKS